MQKRINPELMAKRDTYNTKRKLSSQELADLEAEHAAYLERKGYGYISLEEAARAWNRTPQEMIEWIRVLEADDDDGMTPADARDALREGNGILWDYNEQTGEVIPYDEATVEKNIQDQLKGMMDNERDT